ncbi:glycosyltransferase family 2 protein [Spirosoma montaniterrae]|uniref:Glycosyl transferase family 2 n=1 Tax=Spirosoma montaniterrae TaxID=1178516 RepID=A0A1P9WZJ3_9BACT|nr:glycosyltransferase family 2 protein [Spirosoma montaniterrae]AQG80782.1 glycosyl transferase family 2 [Spirosoma montaniterrae]
MAERKRVANDSSRLVSIITINYNQAETTRQFLDSARNLTYPNIEIIVVDNASAPSLTDCVDLSHYANVRCVRSETNLGFTGGNNLGMSVAKGNFFFIVNNDTELSPTLLDNLLQPFAQDERIGVVCPKIRFYDEPHYIQYAGYRPMNMFTGTATAIGYNQTDAGQYDEPGPTNFAHGCAMLVKRSVVERVGRFAERFFLYYEELDWSQRIRDAGFLIYYQPSATILHKESVSVGQGSPLRTYYLMRNRILFMRRHCTSLQRIVFYLFFTFLVFPKHMVSHLIAGQWIHLRAVWQAVAWNIRSNSMSPV